MKHTLKHPMLAAAVALLFCTPVQAKDDGTDRSVTVERESLHYLVQADGSFVQTQDLELTINEDRAVASQSQRAVFFNQALESIEITEAYTQKPDGRKVKVSPDQIREQQEPQSFNAPMFQDVKAKIVVYPEVAVGDKLVLQVKRHRTTPIFPGQFDDAITPSFAHVRKLSITYDMPESMRLKTEAKGFIPVAAPSTPGRMVYRWDFQPGENARIEAGSVAYFDYGKRLLVSTFTDYAALAKAYDARATDKARPTPKITELARKITAGIDDPRAKALALAEWVKKNIRYVAVYVGAGGVVPHQAESVLDNLYGDCKDHATLLEAMLSAVGIDSTAVLINFGNAYSLPDVPTSTIFNHVITYIPSLDLYIDSTNPSLESGHIAQPEWDKPVLFTRTGLIARTPSVQPTMNLHVARIDVNSKGEADFTYTSTYGAWGAEPMRYAYRNMHPTDLAMWWERVLKSFGYQGSGTIDLGDVKSTSGDYLLQSKGHIVNAVNLPGPVGVPAITGLGGGIGHWVFPNAAEKERTQPYACFSGETREETAFVFPDDVKILGTPNPVTISEPDVDYRSEYLRKDNTVQVKRHLHFHHKGAVCTPEGYKAIKPQLDKMMRDLMSQIVVQGS